MRDDLIRLLSPVGMKKPERRFVRIMSCLVPDMQQSPERYRLYQSLVEPRREAMREVLRRGVAAGELRSDLDIEVVVTALTAPVLLPRMLGWEPGSLGDDNAQRWD